MANIDHIEWLKFGRKSWNERRGFVKFEPDLSDVRFSEVIKEVEKNRNKNIASDFFKRINFSGADLSGADLSSLDFSKGKFVGANLNGANLSFGNFEGADFRGAKFENSILVNSNFTNAKLNNSNLTLSQSRNILNKKINYKNRNVGEVMMMYDMNEVLMLPSSVKGSGDRKDRLLKKQDRYLVLYGTNRKPVVEQDGRVDFEGDRDNKLHFGSCEVVIPEGHKIGSIGSSFWKRLIGGDDRIFIRKVISLNGELYWKVVNDIYCDSKKTSPVTIFIHGYNTKFTDSIKRAAQIGYDLGFNSGISVFSWPSKGETNEYSADESSSEVSQYALAEFLLSHVDKLEGKKINIIAHSMGCRLLMYALQHMARDRPGGMSSINQIIFAAADIDQEMMEKMADCVVQNYGRTTSYVCPGDSALAMSGWLHSFPRVGFVPPIFVADEIDTVNVEKTDLLGFGHGYVSESRSILSDIFQLVVHSLPPECRFSVREISLGKTKYWGLKE